MNPGMSVNDFRAIFPSATIDPQTGKDIVQLQDSVHEVKGLSTYTFFRDTINEYKFASVAAGGPSMKFPSADSSPVAMLMNAARKSYAELMLKFGAPAEKFSASYLFPVKSGADQAVFGAKWKMKGGIFTLKVKLVSVGSPGDPNPNAHSEFEYYSFEIFAMGNAKEMNKPYNLGISKDEFKARYPALAEKVHDSPQIWLAQDSVYGANGEWRARFENGKCVLFSFNAYDGENYKHEGEEAYGLMGKRRNDLISEAEKKWGREDSAGYVALKKYETHSLRNYYSVTHYFGRWKNSNSYLIMKMEESGGGQSGSTVFHLSVYCSDFNYIDR